MNKEFYEPHNKYMQIGRMEKCGHCDKRFEAGLEQIAKNFPDYKCECKCHDNPQKTLENLIVKEWEDKVGLTPVEKELLLQSCQKVEEETTKKVEDEMHKWADDFAKLKMLEVEEEVIKKVEKICADTFSGATLREHKELGEFYEQLDKLSNY